MLTSTQFEPLFTFSADPRPAILFTPFVLSETEFREIAQDTICACYDESLQLGAVADLWTDAILDEKPREMPFASIAASLNVSAAEAERLTDEVKVIARRVHEEQTGMPASW